MRRRVLSILLTAVMILGLFPAGVMAESGSSTKAWEGGVDFSWYNTTDTEFTIKTPEQWAGLAWIVGGYYENLETNDISYTGKLPEKYDNFEGKTILLGADLDMGGIKGEDGTWTGPMFLPLGGRYYYNDNSESGYVSRSGSGHNETFNGTLKGQYHKIYNINANYSSGNYLGIVGITSGSCSIENLWVGDGIISSKDAVGGIAGRFSSSGKIKNCINEANVNLSDGTKGTGGMVGALWSGQGLENCANFGKVTSTFNQTAGLVGDIQSGVVKNCYNMGEVLIKENEGASLICKCTNLTRLENCYYTGTKAVAASNFSDMTEEATEKGLIAKIEEDWSSSALASKLNGKTTRTWVYDSSLNKVLPRGFTSVEDNAAVSEVVLVSGPSKTEYVEGQTFDSAGIVVSAKYSDGTYELVEGWKVDKTEPFTEADGKAGTVTITVSGTLGEKPYSLTTDVTVTTNALDKISVTTWPSLNYLVGDKVDLSSMAVKATYTNGNTESITEGYTVAIKDGETVENGAVVPADWNGKTLVVSYTYRNVTKTAESTSSIVALSTDGAPAKDEDGYYVVKNDADLTWLTSYINDIGKGDINIKLAADVNAAKSIGNSSSRAYAGIFDGNGHTINVGENSEEIPSLFENINGATIKNLTLKGSVSVGYSTAAAFAGGVKGKSVIENCINEVNVTCKGYLAGGFIGSVGSGAEVTVKNCENRGDIKAGSYYAGGIVSSVSGAINIENCKNTATITSDGRYSGGLIGYINAYGVAVTVKNSSNTGNIVLNGSSSSYTAGGIVGYVDRLASGSVVEGCFNTASVTATGSSGAGGIVGYIYSDGTGMAVKNCYNTGNVTGGSSSYKNGAIIGYVTSYSASVAVENCYNTGTIEGMEKSYMSFTPMFAANSASRVAATNCYYLEGCSQTISGTADGVTAKTSAEIKALAATLGSAYKDNTNEEFNGGYPVLAWQEIPVPAAKANITVSSGSMGADGTAELTVSLSDIAALGDSPSIDCFTLYVTPDEALKIESIDMNAGLCSGNTNLVNAEQGSASFAATKANITADGVLFKIKLKAADMSTIENGEYTVSVGVGENGTVGSTDMSGSIKFVSGKVTVDTSVFNNNINVNVTDNTGADVTVTVTPPAEGWTAGTNRFTVSSEKACTVIVKNADGTYTRLKAVTELGAVNTYCFTTDENFGADCEIIISQTGDVDGDGTINQNDYLYVLGAVRGGSLEGITKLRADVNSDGEMNQTDYLYILAALRGGSLNW